MLLRLNGLNALVASLLRAPARFALNGESVLQVYGISLIVSSFNINSTIPAILGLFVVVIIFLGPPSFLCIGSVRRSGKNSAISHGSHTMEKREGCSCRRC